MKSIYSIATGVLLTANVFAQAPQKMSYQAIIRNSSNVLVASTPVGMKISILQGSATGTVTYSETQTPSTNANGLVSLEIGAGTPVAGTFAGINWAAGPYFIKTETDPSGGTAYNIVGTSQLMSVPYALHSSSTSSIDWANVQNKPTIPASFSGSYLDLTNKPTIPASFSGSYLDLTNKPVIVNNTFTGSYTDLTNKLTFTVVATTGSYNDLTNKPTITTFSGNYLDLSNKPSLAIVATTGSYNDLTNKPIIPASFSGSYLDLTNKPTIPVSFSGSYLDLTNKPIITTLTGGNGITINGSNQIVNTATDRIVSITGINVTVSGTYPAFTVTGPAAGGNVGGFTHYLGETYNGGIIFNIYKGSDGLEHGLIVALTESTAQWQTSATLVNANRTEDGAFNTNLMTNSPAATYIATLGAGWYLPSIDELGLLYYNRFYAQKGLRSGGNTLLSNSAYYWSSTENDATNAFFFTFTNGYASLTSKSVTTTVRGIRAF